MLKTPCAMTEFAENSLGLRKMEEQNTPLQLFNLLQDHMFELDIFKRIIKILKECKALSCKITKERIKDHKSQTFSLGDGEGTMKLMALFT